MSVPLPLLKCLLPEYSDEHVWWFIMQFLKASGFNHTASAFGLELKSCRGVSEERFQTVSEEELRAHFGCLLLRQLGGPSPAAALQVAPAPAGLPAANPQNQAACAGQGTSAAQHAGSSRRPQQQQRALQVPPAAQGGTSGGLSSPMDIDHAVLRCQDQTQAKQLQQHLDQQQPSPQAGTGAAYAAANTRVKGKQAATAAKGKPADRRAPAARQQQQQQQQRHTRHKQNQQQQRGEPLRSPRLPAPAVDQQHHEQQQPGHQGAAADGALAALQLPDSSAGALQPQKDGLPSGDDVLRALAAPGGGLAAAPPAPAGDPAGAHAAADKAAFSAPAAAAGAQDAAAEGALQLQLPEPAAEQPHEAAVTPFTRRRSRSSHGSHLPLEQHEQHQQEQQDPGQHSRAAAGQPALSPAVASPGNAAGVAAAFSPAVVSPVNAGAVAACRPAAGTPGSAAATAAFSPAVVSPGSAAAAASGRPAAGTPGSAAAAAGALSPAAGTPGSAAAAAAGRPFAGTPGRAAFSPAAGTPGSGTAAGAFNPAAAAFSPAAAALSSGTGAAAGAAGTPRLVRQSSVATADVLDFEGEVEEDAGSPPAPAAMDAYMPDAAAEQDAAADGDGLAAAAPAATADFEADAADAEAAAGAAAAAAAAAEYADGAYDDGYADYSGDGDEAEGSFDEDMETDAAMGDDEQDILAAAAAAATQLQALENAEELPSVSADEAAAVAAANAAAAAADGSLEDEQLMAQFQQQYEVEQQEGLAGAVVPLAAVEDGAADQQHEQQQEEEDGRAWEPSESGQLPETSMGCHMDTGGNQQQQQPQQQLQAPQEQQVAAPANADAVALAEAAAAAAAAAAGMAAAAQGAAAPPGAAAAALGPERPGALQHGANGPARVAGARGRSASPDRAGQRGRTQHRRHNRSPSRSRSCSKTRSRSRSSNSSGSSGSTTSSSGSDGSTSSSGSSRSRSRGRRRLSRRHSSSPVRRVGSSRGRYRSTSPRDRSKEGFKAWGEDGHAGKHHPGHGQQQQPGEGGQEGQQQHWDQQRGGGHYRGRGRGYGRYSKGAMAGRGAHASREGGPHVYDLDARKTNGHWNAEPAPVDPNRPASRYDLTADTRGGAAVGAGGHRPTYLNTRTAPANGTHPGTFVRGRGRGRYGAGGAGTYQQQQHDGSYRPYHQEWQGQQQHRGSGYRQHGAEAAVDPAAAAAGADGRAAGWVEVGELPPGQPHMPAPAAAANGAAPAAHGHEVVVQGKEGGRYDWPPKDHQAGGAGGYRQGHTGYNTRLANGGQDGSGHGWDNRGGAWRGGSHGRGRGAGPNGTFGRAGTGRADASHHWRAEPAADTSPAGQQHNAGAGAAAAGANAAERWRMGSEERDSSRHGSAQLSAGSPAAVRSHAKIPPGPDARLTSPHKTPKGCGPQAGAVVGAAESAAGGVGGLQGGARPPVKELSEALKRRLGPVVSDLSMLVSDLNQQQAAKRPRMDAAAAGAAGAGAAAAAQ